MGTDRRARSAQTSRRVTPVVVEDPIVARRTRYRSLREQRPRLFANDGPVVIDHGREETGCGVVHADPWIMFVVDPVVMPDGRLGRYGRLMTTIDAEGVAILPMTRDGRIVLLRHWRHATQSWHVEAPRGFGEIGLEPRLQAAAELREELCVEGEMIALGHLHPDTGLLASRVALFLAMLPDDAAPFHPEGLASVLVMDEAGFEDAVLDGSITDPFAIAIWSRRRIREDRMRRAVPDDVRSVRT